MFSVLILTLNEERNLPSCLASLTRCDDIVVLDSGSSDRTNDIAQKAGARVVVRAFTDFADQRNFALETIAFKNKWVFHLDADEHLTPELIQECSALSAQNPDSLDGFFAAPRMLYHGHWIPHCTDFPAYQARFGHVRRFRFVQVGHGQREQPGLRLGKLQASYLHNLSAHSDAELEDKHRNYARQEAARFLACPPESQALTRRLFSPDALVRRRALKTLSQHLPARGPLRFLYQYFWRLGFLDGRAGLTYCVLLSRYEHWIAVEIRRQHRTATPV
jgi:glycosyltransferase involved in cell wall biosynthesis